jgi:hypothetical protein
VSEHDPFRTQFAEVPAQRRVVEVVADRPVEGVRLDGEQIRSPRWPLPNASPLPTNWTLTPSS